MLSCNWRSTLNNPNLIYKANIDFEVPASISEHAEIIVVNGVTDSDFVVECETTSIAKLEPLMLANIKAYWTDIKFLTESLDYENSTLSIRIVSGDSSKAIATITLKAKSEHYFLSSSSTSSTFDIILNLVAASGTFSS